MLNGLCVCLCASHLRVSLRQKEHARGGKDKRQQRAATDAYMYVFLPPYPPRHSGVGPLFELGVCGKAVPHDVGRVVLVPQLRTALKQEVYDEELDTGVQTWRGEGKGENKRRIRKRVKKLICKERLSAKSCTAVLLLFSRPSIFQLKAFLSF